MQRCSLLMRPRSAGTSLTVILLLSAGAFAIHQHKDFEVLAENIVERAGGSGSEHGGKPVVFSHSQSNYDIGSGGIALQNARALIGQSATAWGFDGTSSANQIGSGIGCQDQTVGGIWAQYVGHPTIAQQQGLAVDLSEVVQKHDGFSGARGIQNGLARQRQSAITPDGLASQSQTIFPMQIAHVRGRGSDSIAAQIAKVHTGQSQVN